MEDEFNQSFDVYLDEYKSNSLSKNDLKEHINTLSKERDLIRIIFERCSLDPNLIRDFTISFDNLFNILQYKIIKQSISDKIYDFRNLVTHSYRNVAERTDTTNRLIQLFEELMVNTLINYNTKVPQ